MMQFTGESGEQRGWRPGLVFQNNVGNEYSPNIIALPFTTAIKKIGQPTHVLLHSDECGIQKDSVVLCENPERMSKCRIGQYITTLSNEQMAKIAEASLLATAAISFINIDRLRYIWERAVSMNN